MSKKGLYNMTNQAELVNEEFREMLPWTSLELRSRLMELRPTRSKSAVNSGSSKAELVEHAKKLLLTVTPNDTRGSLLRKIKEIGNNEEASGQTLMGFGKHGSKTYREVLDSDPSYVIWAREARDDGGASAKLIKFVNWTEQVAKESVDNKSPKKESVAASPGRASTAASSSSQGSSSANVMRKGKRGGEDADVAALKSQNEELKAMVKEMGNLIAIMTGNNIEVTPSAAREEDTTSESSFKMVHPSRKGGEEDL